MQHKGPWDKIASEPILTTQHFRVYRDRVKRPDGVIGQYDWVAAPDQVRVAALVGDSLLLVDQYHYLVGQTLQLPGGNLEGRESSEDAARRELQQETGYSGGDWISHGFVSPLPALTPARVHLWSVRNLTRTTASPEPSESDLRIVELAIQAAKEAVLAGRVQCAASASLIQQVLACARH
jgi:ADP-ribose pyrophosphatase